MLLVSLSAVQNRGPTSLWNYNDKADMPTDPVDYCIVGAGMTGMCARSQLGGHGCRVVLT